MESSRICQPQNQYWGNDLVQLCWTLTTKNSCNTRAENIIELKLPAKPWNRDPRPVDGQAKRFRRNIHTTREFTEFWHELFPWDHKSIEAAENKPDPAVYACTPEKLGVHAERSIAFEDSASEPRCNAPPSERALLFLATARKRRQTSQTSLTRISCKTLAAECSRRELSIRWW